MTDDQKEYYQRLTEEIFSKPVEERDMYIRELKNEDMEYFERIEHLVRFVTSREDLLEDYAYNQIKRIINDLHQDD